VGPVAYTLELPEELSNVYNTFHVSNLKKCLSDESLIIPMKELRLDDKLNFVEEPIEIMDQEVKQLRQSRIPIVKVKWNSKRGPEFTQAKEEKRESISYLEAKVKKKEVFDSSPKVFRKRYKPRKGRKTKPKRQNWTRNGKAVKDKAKSKPKTRKVKVKVNSTNQQSKPEP
ncbi:hypothetical protein Tco_0497757, partial [Tanacetum coccineum]